MVVDAVVVVVVLPLAVFFLDMLSLSLSALVALFLYLSSLSLSLSLLVESSWTGDDILAGEEKPPPTTGSLAAVLTRASFLKMRLRERCPFNDRILSSLSFSQSIN